MPRTATTRRVALLDSAGVSLGNAIGGLVAVLDPAAVVLGGGLGSAAGPLRDALDRAYAGPRRAAALAAARRHRPAGAARGAGRGGAAGVPLTRAVS